MSLLNITLNYTGGNVKLIYSGDNSVFSGKEIVDTVKRLVITDVFLKCKGGVCKTALEMDMNKSTIGNHLRNYGLLHVGGGKTDLYIELQQEYNIAKNNEVTR